MTSSPRWRRSRSSSSKALVWQDFDGCNCGVVLGGNEIQQQFPLGVRLQPGDGAGQRPVLSDFLEDVQVAQYQLASAEDVEHACAVGLRRADVVIAVGGAEAAFDEVQGQLVAA